VRHFFTRSTVEASIHCKKCGKPTPWAISGGRPSYCKLCFATSALKSAEAVKPPQETQQGLFNPPAQEHES
jgi:hypothetical protein